MKNYMQNSCCILQQMRKLWTQHVYWTRLFIISTLSNLGDLEAVTNRLLRNPKDFEKLLKPIYGAKKSAEFEKLLTEHLMIGGDLVNAAKANETEKADVLRKKWYQNADEIAVFLSSINSCQSREKWQKMLYDHLAMTEKEVMLRLKGDYKEDIKNFDSIENEALKMADYMFCGVSKYIS